MMIGLDTTFLVAAVHQEHAQHQDVNRLVDQWLKDGDEFALCAHVVSEFLHVVTDGRRFENPLSMEDALTQAEEWMSAGSCRWLDSTEEVAVTAMGWIAQHRLGRKRILDTFIAATYAAANVLYVATLNPADFRIFDVFEFLPSTDA